MKLSFPDSEEYPTCRFPSTLQSSPVGEITGITAYKWANKNPIKSSHWRRRKNVVNHN